MINCIYNKIDFLEHLQSIEKSTFEQVFVSIGSKYNGVKTPFPSNTDFQMFPRMYREKENVVLIIFDFFRDDLEKTIERLRIFLTNPSHLCLVVNLASSDFQYISPEQNIIHMIDIILDYFQKGDKITICNYVKFFNESPKEEQKMNLLMKNLQVVINKKKLERYNILYEWFGYNYTLFNIIYNYKYIPLSLSYFLNSIKREIGDKEYLSKSTIDKIIMEIETEDTIHDEKLYYFLKNCIDIA